MAVENFFIIIIRAWTQWSNQILMRDCTEQVELWWVIYGSFSPFSAVQDMNERQDLQAFEEHQQLILQGRCMNGHFSCISKLDTYLLRCFMGFLTLKNAAHFVADSNLLSLKNELLTNRVTVVWAAKCHRSAALSTIDLQQESRARRPKLRSMCWKTCRFLYCRGRKPECPPCPN